MIPITVGPLQPPPPPNNSPPCCTLLPSDPVPGNTAISQLVFSVSSLPRKSILCVCVCIYIYHMAINIATHLPKPSPLSSLIESYCFLVFSLVLLFLFSLLLIALHQSLIPWRVPCSIKSMSALVSSCSSSPREQMLADNEIHRPKLLAAVNDDHEGVIVELNEPMDSQVFASMLAASISQWRKQGKKGAWIKVPIQLVNLVEAAVKQGFWYHHAEPTYLMLVYWIPEGENTIPANASHRVSIGAFVMNDKGEVLVVQEKNGIFRGSGIWKFPTGVLEEGEDICTAAIREVKEETGIDCEFVEVLAFREHHKAFFNKSDLFFVCMLRPVSFDIQIQELEIEAAEWIPFGEYSAQPFVQKNEFLLYVLNICLAKTDEKYDGFLPVVTASGFLDKKSYLYFNRRDLTTG